MRIFNLLQENKNFRLLWWGQLISALGDRLTQMGILNVIMVLSGDDGSRMALVTFFSLLPFLLFGPLFGAMADRYSRKKIMMGSDIFLAFLVICLPWIWASTHSVALILFFVFLIGIFSSLFSPAKMSIVSNLVDKERLLEANSFMATSGMVATLVGTLLAGILIRIAGVRFGFYLNGLTFIVSALFIFFISYPAIARLKGDIPNAYRDLNEEVREGLQYIGRHLLLIRPIQLSSVFSLINAFAYILILRYGAQALQLGALGLGVLLSSAGLGMIGGSAFLILRKNRVNYSAILAFSYLLIGLGLCLFLNRPNIFGSIGLLLIAGFGVSCLEISLDTIVQRIVPDDLKGKVFGARGVVTNAVFLCSLLLVGLLIKVIPVTVLFFFIGLIAVGCSLLIYVSEHEWPYRLFRFCLCLFLKIFFDFKVSGLENLPSKQKVILAANHSSFLDPVVLICAYPRRVYFLAAEFLFHQKFLGWILTQAGCIPVKKEGPNKEAFKEALRILNVGYSLGIFPEGKITEDGRLVEGKQGVAVLAKAANVAIVPIAIEGTFEAMPKNRNLPRRFPIEVRFGKPLEVTAFADPQELTLAVMTEIGEVKQKIEQEGYLRVDPSEIIRHLINIG